jgi:hypothetical protein
MRAGLAPIASASPRPGFTRSVEHGGARQRNRPTHVLQFFREELMVTQVDKLLTEFTDQIIQLTDQLNRSIDADERDQLSFVLDEYKRVVIKLERMIKQRAMEHEKASRNQSEEL